MIDQNDLKFVEKIGSGLFGEVYLAHLKSLNVAVKVIFPFFVQMKIILNYRYYIITEIQSERHLN